MISYGLILLHFFEHLRGSLFIQTKKIDHLKLMIKDDERTLILMYENAAMIDVFVLHTLLAW